MITTGKAIPNKSVRASRFEHERQFKRCWPACRAPGKALPGGQFVLGAALGFWRGLEESMT